MAFPIHSGTLTVYLIKIAGNTIFSLKTDNFSLYRDLWISASETSCIPHYWSDIGLKGTVVNLYGKALEITTAISLTAVQLIESLAVTDILN